MTVHRGFRLLLLVGGLLMPWLMPGQSATAHHILGRPSYSLNEDSNTPPSVTVETQAGGYALTYMVYPDLPRPGAPGRINFYAKRLADGAPFAGKVKFLVRLDSWLTWFGVDDHTETIGVQSIDDAVFRQGVYFGSAGDYIISAEFKVDDAVHRVDFPLRVGIPSAVGPIGILIGGAFILLIGFALVQRRRALTGKVRDHRDYNGRDDHDQRPPS